MAQYAEKTGVSSASSRDEIERTLKRYGATAFAYGWDEQVATVMFEIAGRRVRFQLRMPDRRSREFTHTPDRGLPRTAEKAEAAWEQAGRQRWRALALVIKAKLEAVEAQISTVESEFLAHIVLPNGSSVGEWFTPQLELAYSSGQMPALMPGGER